MKRKLLWWGGGAAVLLVLFAAAAVRNSNDAPRQPDPRRDFDVGIPTAQEVRAMLGAYGERVESNEREIQELKTELGETRRQLRESLEALGAERKEDLGSIETLLRDLQTGTPRSKTETGRAARFRTFEFEKTRPRGLVVPAGSFGEATLLTGVYAPTGGEPLPVLLRLDAALIGPNRTRVPVRDAFLVGKAAGDANSRRAIVQLDRLSIVFENGESIETRVNGWVIDDDGIQGLDGQYVWRADEILALSGLSAGLSAGADALAARETLSQLGPVGQVVSTITGDPVRFAANKSLSASLARMSEIVSARLQEVVPAIYVTNGKSVTVAFISSVTLARSEESRD